MSYSPVLWRRKKLTIMLGEFVAKFGNVGPQMCVFRAIDRSPVSDDVIEGDIDARPLERAAIASA